MVLKQDVILLIDELYDASVAYYEDGGVSELSDDEFDAKQDYLDEVFNKGLFPELFVEGGKGYEVLEKGVFSTGVNLGDKVVHSTPMLSLKKAKTVSELSGFLNKMSEFGCAEFKLQPKIDGIALSVRYSGGSLVGMATRGDGKVGENSMFLMEDSNVTVVGVPESITVLEDVELRGELVFSDSQFSEVNDSRVRFYGQGFKNARNAVSGLHNRARLGVDYPVEFTFLTYSVLIDGKLVSLSNIDDILPVDSLIGFSVLKASEVLSAINEFGSIRGGLGYPTDGVVIKPVNEEEFHKKLGATSHHPSSQIAWKYPAEKAKSEVLKVDISVGKSGRLTPRAHISPVFLDGSVVSKVSLHNFNNVLSKGIKIGSIVLVEKANDIIPHISSVLSNPSDSVDIKVPSSCPACGTSLVGDSVDGEVPKTLSCPNESCSSRDFYSLLSAVDRRYLNIDRLSESVLTFLYDSEVVKDVSDLYLLNEDVLADSVNGYMSDGTPRRLGEKTAKHIINHIEESKSLPPYRLLASLSIPNLGLTMSELVLREFSFERLLNVSVSELELIKGIGPVTARNIVEGLKAKRDIIDKMISLGVSFIGSNDGVLSNSFTVNDGVLDGISFSISGSVPDGFKNRAEFVEFLKSNGGVFHSSPKKSTDYLVGSVDDTSSKVMKAKRLNVNIISPSEFLKLFNV